MKKMFFLLVGIGLSFSVYADNNDLGNNSGTNANPGLNTNPNTNANPSVTPKTTDRFKPNPADSFDPNINSNPGLNNDHSLGSGGNTLGVGTDNGGGNGPSNY